MRFLYIAYPDIARHTLSIILQVLGGCALLGYIAAMPMWTWPFSILALAIMFYTGYYFELGFRSRRWQEFRYGGEKEPKKSFDEKLWRERRDAHKENRKCDYCGKIFCPTFSDEVYCSNECGENSSRYAQTLGDA